MGLPKGNQQIIHSQYSYVALPDTLLSSGLDTPPAPIIQKQSRFEQSRQALVRGNGDIEHTMTSPAWYYVNVSVGDAIDKLGWWKPLLHGRPKQFTQMLLNAIPSPCAGKGYKWKSCGLMYFTPPIIGRARSRNRTSATGLALLKHWADKNPAFRPFLDAYHSKKAEEEITLDCVDLALDTLPRRFKEILVLNEKVALQRMQDVIGQQARSVPGQTVMSQGAALAQLAQAQAQLAAQNHLIQGNAYQNQLLGQHGSPQQGVFGGIFKGFI
jgi:hypothetical protein